MINYVEGQVSIGGQALHMNSVGSAQLMAGQTLTTGNGRAEILLTPGTVLRVAEHSSLTMISPDLANIEVRLGSGRAMVEVADIFKDNSILFDENGTATRLLKKGLYDFDAVRAQIRVFDGEAVTQMGQREITLKGDHELNLNDPDKAHKFDREAYEDTFYRWASLRSDYLAQANLDAGRSYSSHGDLWVDAGWYWDPWFGAYTFIPASGVLYSPFGWGYYSPWMIHGVPYAYYGHSFHHFGRDFGRMGNHGFAHRGEGFHAAAGFHGGHRRG